jgi:hypothetical protein
MLTKPLDRFKHILAAAALTTSLSGCTVAFEGNFSYPGVPCHMMSGWCVVELPTVGFLAYGAGNSGELDHTIISFRLAPRDGVTAAWSSTEITLVDLDTNKSMQVKALDAAPVTGRKLYLGISEEQRTLYGPYSPGEFRLSPRIAKMEVRMPPVLRDGQMVQVPPVRLNDGIRMPRIVLLPLIP